MPGQLAEAGLREAVDGDVLERVGDVERADRDDRAALALLDHCASRPLREEIRQTDVDPHDPVPCRGIHLDHRHAPVDHSVVDEHVDGAEPLERRGDDLVGGSIVGQADNGCGGVDSRSDERRL